jgi:hypothetical protein
MAIEPVDEFLCDDLSVEAVYTPYGEAARAIRVIWGDPFMVSNVAGVEYQNAAPVVLASTESVEGATDQATLAVAGIVYNVREVQPDGTGFTRLILSKD